MSACTDFKNLWQVNEMATKNHPNLVRLVGYCLDFSPVTERMEQIVIYEFMPHGDLEHWIGPCLCTHLSSFLTICFGVVMLTVLTARKAICNLESDQVNLKAWVAPLVASNNVAAFKDPDLIASDTIILRLARLALSCTAMPTASRPSISRVLAELTVIKEDCLGLDSNRMAERIDKELDTISQDFDGELARIASIKSRSLR
ncbi:unnamed protein product [Closterium sp. NIES-64]|nr:unnamed protein product [Closterium sp. NIES-64]